MATTLLIFLAGLTAAAADFDVKNNAEFQRILGEDAVVTRLATDLQFVEGPVWIAKGGYLVFSDIPADEMKRWDATGVQTYRKPSGQANGNALDREGRLVSAEHGNRRISRTLPDGTIETVVDAFEGKRLNSPNDVVVKSDGSIWFTDPDYGLKGRAKEVDGNHVYRFDPKKKLLTAVAKDFEQPNGLCFSPDERKLFVADSGKSKHHIRVFSVAKDGTLAGGEVFVTIDNGNPDGIRCDAAGRLWSSSGDGVQVFTPKGELIVRIRLPEAAANLAFGGKKGKTLFLTARKSLYSVETLVKDGGKRK